MDEKPFEKIIEKEFAFLFEAGFYYEYTYDKGSDSSCVYIYRFRRGRDFFDFRTVSGGKERNTVAFANGQYVFPNLKLRHKKAFGAFHRKHFFKKATDEELWAFAAQLLKAESESGTLFGIPLL
jgi:hypothetical protein